MADTPAPATAAPTAASEPAAAATAVEGTAPAADAPKPGPTLADIKAARRTKAQAADQPAGAAGDTRGLQTAPQNAAENAPKPPAGEKPATATIDMDGDALKNFTELNRQLREARTKTKNLEERIAGFGRFEKAQSLAKEGKHYDAAREAGIDVDAALAELLGKTDGNPTSGQIDKKLAEQIADLQKFKDDTVKEREERKKADADASAKAERQTVGKFVTDNVAKYPFLAKSQTLVDLAYRDYEVNQTRVEAEEGREMTAEEKSRLLLAALAVHEEDWAKSFGGQSAAAPVSTGETAPGVDAGARAGVKQPAPTVAKKVTFEELKRERAAKRKSA